MSEPKISLAAENFIKLAKELADQESAGKIDPNIRNDVYEAAKELVTLSDPILTTNCDDQLKDLREVLFETESSETARVKRSYQASIGRLAGTAVAGAVGTALSSFAKGYFTRLGQQAADAYPVFGPNGIFNEGINDLISKNSNQMTLSEQLKNFNENNWN